MVPCTPAVWAISATVCSLLPSDPVAAYMRRTVAALAALSLGLRPPVRLRARAASRIARIVHQGHLRTGNPARQYTAAS